MRPEKAAEPSENAPEAAAGGTEARQTRRSCPAQNAQKKRRISLPLRMAFTIFAANPKQERL